MKKVLILTVTAGNGHNSAANAVKEACLNKGAEAKVVDLLHEFCDSKTYRWINEVGYGLACQYACGIYNMFFKHYQKADAKKYYKSPVQKPLIKMYDKLLKYINDYQPDAIFCSHFYPCIMLSNLKKIYDIPAKIYSFISDYEVCPYWECATGIDYLLVPNESYFECMISKGFKKEQLLPYGLTVRPKFDEVLLQEEARKELGIENKFTVFVMYGGGFWSGNYKIVKNLAKNIKHPIQIVVANGRDEKGKKKIDKIKIPENITLHNYGFCKNVDVIMSAADVLVGKAGGISVTEALNKCLPLIAGSGLPQQEKGNVEMLLKTKAGKQYKNKKQLIKILNEIIENPQNLTELKENIKKTRHPNASNKVADLMIACDVEYSNVLTDFSCVNENIKMMLKNRGIYKRGGVILSFSLICFRYN